MKTFREFIHLVEQLKPLKTPEELAKKHKVSLSYMKKQFKDGLKIECEHTKSDEYALRIASHHLDEFPDYYERLIKMEAEVKKSIKEGTLHHWFKGSKSKDGKPGWVQADGSPCANEPGETKTPKCFSSARLAALKKKGKVGKNIIKSAIRRKRQQDPNQQEKSGASRPTMVKTFSGGKKNKHYIKAEPTLKEATKDSPGKGSGTKDACYYKVKSRFKVWPSAYACVPEQNSKALTKDGWKTVNELKLGEEILTYNLKKDELEFKPIVNIHRYKNAKTNVVQSGNTGFIFECTDNHKWVINIPYQKGSIGTKYDKINEMFFMDTKDLLERKSNKRLVVSAPYRGGTSIKKDFIYKYEDNWIKYILEITEEQRQSWLFSSIVYDGNQKKVERKTTKPDLIEEKVWKYTSPYNKQSFGFKQKDIQHRDAFLLSAFLNGGTVSWKKYKDKDLYSCNYISNKRFKNTSNFKLVEERTADVWCPETENGTWVLYQETNGKGIITITGNSGALVKCRKVGAANWGNKSKNKVNEEYTRLQETGNTYSILLSWKGIYRMIQFFIPGFIRPSKDSITNEVDKIYPGAKVLNYKPSTKDPTKPYFFYNCDK